LGVPQNGGHQVVCAEVVRLLRQERKRRKLSCYAVSQRSGVSQSMLSLVERGLRNPTLELLLRIANGLEIDLSAVLKRAQMPVSKSKKK
jgi:transcriptional regulator with XRE-family HTH domain